MNDAVEIIGGEGIELAFKDLNINAKCTYKSKQLPFYAEVWEISVDDFKMLCDYPDELEHSIKVVNFKISTTPIQKQST